MPHKLVQPWVTLEGDGSTYAVMIYPHEEEWLNTDWFKNATLGFTIKSLTGGTTTVARLGIETAPSPNGPWQEIGGWTSTTEINIFLTRDPMATTQQRMSSLIRPAVREGDGAWEICYQLYADLE